MDCLPIASPQRLTMAMAEPTALEAQTWTISPETETQFLVQFFLQ